MTGVVSSERLGIVGEEGLFDLGIFVRDCIGFSVLNGRKIW